MSREHDISNNSSSDTSFSTQSGNFGNAVSGGVDPRTGTYSISINLGQLNGNGQLGPVFPVNLSYSPQPGNNNSNSMRLGNGVGLGVSMYDTETKRLSLSTGEAYQISEGKNNAVTVKQKKLDSFHFEKQGSETYKIAHCTGDLEFLPGSQYADTPKLPGRIVNAAGHSLFLSTDDNNRLAKVSDETDTLLSIDYNNKKITLTFYPGKPESYTAVLQLTSSGNLETITRPSNSKEMDDLVWRIGYTDMGIWGHWATSLTHPGGMTETVEYRTGDSAHHFPDRAPISKALPNVKTFTRDPGAEQPAMVSTYTFSNHNYLGYGGEGGSWNDQEDYLYSCPSDYIYSSTETQLNGNEPVSIKRTYNNYHLQKTEETTCGNCVVTKVMTYYTDSDLDFEQQPPQFQCPTSTSTTWTDSSNKEKVLSRTEVVKTEFAESGVQTYQMDADGTETTWEYYPAEGGADCPKEPNGFTHFTKSETVTPRSPAYGAPVHKTLYTYATVDHVGTDVSALVMKKTEKHYVDDVLLKTITCEYGKNAEKTAGVLTQKTTTYPDPDSPKTVYTTTEAATFADATVSVDGQNIAARVSTYTLTGHDGLAVTRSKTVSRMTDRLLESTDSKGIVTAYTYNTLGWLTKRVHCQGDNDYKNTTTCEYSVATGGGMCATTTDQNKNKIRHELDGMGRLLRIKKNDVDMDSTNTEPEFLMQLQAWDALGRSLTGIAHDYRGAADKKPLTVTQTLSYDDWGQVSQSVSSEGVTTHTETVLVPSLTKDISSSVWQTRSWQSGREETSGITVITLDNNHNPVKTEMYPKGATIGKDTAYSVTTRVYDGWSRLVSQTEASDPTDKLPPEKTTYAYDVWDRPTVTTLPDGTQTAQEYVAFSSAKLPTAIRVHDSKGNPVPGVGGEQGFDGLGRLKNTASGGRSEVYRYDQPYQRHPSRVITATGNQEMYTRIDALGEIPESLNTVGTGVNVSQRWTYNTVTAAMLTATEDQHTLTYSYAASGQQAGITVGKEGGTGTKNTTLNDRTIGGTATTITDYAGRKQTLTLDEYGRATALYDDDVSSTLDYDGLGQIRSWTATDKKTRYTKTTLLTLDDYGRETGRTIETRDGSNILKDTLTITQAWSRKHQVTRRTTTQMTTGKPVVLRDETYNFHPKRGWLTYYGVIGSAPPRDESGRSLSQQVFTYDPVTGNMVSKTTLFTDGTMSTTNYKYENDEDLCQLSRIVTDGKSVTLEYDGAGRLTRDEYGRTLSYDALGRLYDVKKGANTLSRYWYGADNKLCGQTTGDITTHHYYANNTLSYLEDNQKNSTRLTPYAQVSKGKNAGTWLASADMTGSVLAVNDGSISENHAYTPYGVRSSDTHPADNSVALTGYNGERLDGTLTQYHLGNGYRAYNPALQRFTCPDSMSPFGQGGINPYIYCEGDPINLTDPTGHGHEERHHRRRRRRDERTAVESIALGAQDATGGIETDPLREHQKAMDKYRFNRKTGANANLPSEHWKEAKKRSPQEEIEWIRGRFLNKRDVKDKTRNAAFLEYAVGDEKGSLASISGQKYREYLVPTPEEKKRAFKTVSTTKNGKKHNRDYDTEAKLLEAMNSRLSDDTQAHGTVYLYSTLSPCQSCYGVIEAFREKFPNIRLELEWG
ncbi:RHS repeat-associated core domain-containing protein [Photorhabdus tasmaniensis]